MNKQEAIALMKQGAKITHRLFTRDEWIRDEPLVNGTSRIKSEDGCTHTYEEFFETRTSHRWDDGYSVWEPREKPMTATEVMESQYRHISAELSRMNGALIQPSIDRLVARCEREPLDEPPALHKLVYTRTPLPKVKWKKLSESEADDAVLSDNSLLHDLPYVGISPAASDEPMTATEVMESEKEHVNRAREMYHQLESYNLRPLPDTTPTVFSGMGVPRYMTGADLVTAKTSSTDNTIRQMILSSPEKVRELLLTDAARNAVMRVHVTGEKGMLSRDYSLLYGGSIHLNSVMLKTLWTKGYLTREEVSSRSGGIQHLYKVNEEMGL